MTIVQRSFVVTFGVDDDEQFTQPNVHDIQEALENHFLYQEEDIWGSVCDITTQENENV